MPLALPAQRQRTRRYCPAQPSTPCALPSRGGRRWKMRVRTQRWRLRMLIVIQRSTRGTSARPRCRFGPSTCQWSTFERHPRRGSTQQHQQNYTDLHNKIHNHGGADQPFYDLASWRDRLSRCRSSSRHLTPPCSPVGHAEQNSCVPSLKVPEGHVVHCTLPAARPLPAWHGLPHNWTPADDVPGNQTKQ